MPSESDGPRPRQTDQSRGTDPERPGPLARIANGETPYHRPVPKPSQPIDFGAPAQRLLREADRRKLRIWRAIVKTSLTLAWLSLAIELALFLWPGAPKGVRIAVGAVLVESLLTAAVLGAMGKCPACQASFGIDSKRVMPDRCRSCGVALA